MNTMRRSTIILAMFCIGPSASADDVSARKALGTVRVSPGYAASIEAAARESSTWTVNPCFDAKAKLGVPTVVDVPQRDANGSVTTGRWLEHVAMDGCQTERLLNVAVEASAAGLAFRPSLPGSTRAPLPLQDALGKRVFSAAGVEPGGCRPYVLGADYDRRSKPDQDDGDDEPVAAGWRERWIVAQCGMRAAVSVEFPTDPMHGEIAVRLVKRYAP